MVRDVAALEQIVGSIEKAIGSRPSLGQVASVILRTHLDELRKAANEPIQSFAGFDL